MYSQTRIFPEIAGKIVGVDGVHVVEEGVQREGVPSALEKEKGISFCQLLGACCL